MTIVIVLTLVLIMFMTPRALLGLNEALNVRAAERLRRTLIKIEDERLTLLVEGSRVMGADMSVSMRERYAVAIRECRAKRQRIANASHADLLAGPR